MRLSDLVIGCGKQRCWIFFILFAESREFLGSLNGKPQIRSFVFYFSGPSDERGLHFRDGLFPKDEFHSFLREVPAQVKVAVLDSCYSGALAAKRI
ncbi:MAG: hypothetical protein NTV34_09135 [Proteobacteria bacterium]|nr:hypothetical protein [Pseudomonadota bacterium]